MKGIILAGGRGTRLHPLTKVTNKHLLPVYDRPMIYFPLQTLCAAGIDDITIVTSVEAGPDFRRLLGDAHNFGARRLSYIYQETAGGIADALRLCEEFAGNDRICVMLGDNILGDDIAPYVRAYERQASGARVLLKAVADPQRFGVADIAGGRIVGIEEKPERPKSSYAVTGVYFYDRRAFEYIRALRPSARRELEITDVNNAYLRAGDLAYDVLDGWWSDAGQFESLLHAAQLVAQSRHVSNGTRAGIPVER